MSIQAAGNRARFGNDLTLPLSLGKRNAVIYGVYLLLTLIITYPSFLSLLEPYTTAGGFNDSRYFLWHLWWVKRAILDLGILPTYTKAIFHPLGGTLVLQSPLNELASLMLLPLLGLTRTYSLLSLLSFPTAAYTMYLLGFYLTRRRWAAFIGGLIFSFSVRHYAHATEHLGLWTVQWMPLYALALFLFLQKQSPRRGGLLAASFVLAVATDHVYHVAYYILPLTGLFFIYHYFIVRLDLLHRRRFWLAFGGTMLAGLVVVLPIYPHLLLNSGESFLQREGVLFYSPDILSYVIPARTHPVWGPRVSGLYENMHKHRVESANFLGYTALILGLIGFWAQRNRTTKFWLLFGSIAFIFSLGPILYFLGPIELVFEENVSTHIALPYAFLLELPFVSLLRAPARLAIVVQLCLAVLATFGLSYLARRWPGFWRPVVYVALGAIILFETLFAFPYPVDRESLIPHPIYKQIAREENQLAVLELPSRRLRPDQNLVPTEQMRRWDIYYYLYYATIHDHPLVGGLAARTPSATIDFLDTTPLIRELIYPTEWLQNSDTDVLAADLDALQSRGVEMLIEHEIGYVVVHKDLLVEYVDEVAQEIPVYILRQMLGQPFYEDEAIAGFRVPQNNGASPPAQEALLLGSGWYPNGQQFYNQPVRWMGKTGSLLIYEPESTTRRLSLTTFSPMANYVTATLAINDTVLETFPVAPSPFEPEIRLTTAFPLQAGLNILKLDIEPVGPPVRPLDPRVYLGAFDISLLPVTGMAAVEPQQSLRANLGSQIELVGFDQTATILRPGEALQLTLYWQGLRQMDESFKVFVHLVDELGNRPVQQDKIPQDWQLPTTAWAPGEVVIDPYTLEIPADMLPGRYQIQIGMYSEATLQRLPVQENGDLSDHILLGEIEIQP